jgi:isochorismate hydrolase
MSTKLFTVAGVTTHTGSDVTLTKVRFGTDLIRVIKMLNNSKKIWHTETKQCLLPKRVNIVELPQLMSKHDATKFLLTHPEFQSADDQALLKDALGAREPKAPRVKKEKVVKAKKAELSLDSIKARAKKAVTADQLLEQLVTE